MYIDGDLHRPPELKVEWSSLQFKGFLSECTERFVRFDEQGRPGFPNRARAERGLFAFFHTAWKNSPFPVDKPPPLIV